jgi:Lon protease-like protein
VRVNQELPDGRSNIVVLGGSRFVLSRILDESLPYTVALVQTFDDDANSSPSPEEVATLRKLFTSYIAGLRELSDTEPEEPTLSDEPLSLSFQVAGAVECDPGIKHRLLAESECPHSIVAAADERPRESAQGAPACTHKR